MRIKLTDKISSYAPKALRDLFLGNCQWLGTVVVDDGRRGALMLTADGNYVMVQSHKRTTTLPPDQVAAALAEAMMPKGAQSTRGVGRPAEHGEPMLHRMVSLPAAAIEHARKVGAGNLSAGIRLMVLDHMARGGA